MSAPHCTVVHSPTPPLLRPDVEPSRCCHVVPQLLQVRSGKSYTAKILDPRMNL